MAMLIAKLAMGLGLGGALGAALGYFGSCTSGSCPLTANPWRGALFGAVMGLAFSLAMGPAGCAADGGDRRADKAAGTPQAEGRDSAKGEVADAANAPREIASEEDFKTTVEDAKGIVFVDFHASWCGWCVKLAPIVDKLAADYAGKVTFVKVDTDQLQDLAGRYKVQGLPTMIVFKDGKPAQTIVGYRDEAALKKILDGVLSGSK